MAAQINTILGIYKKTAQAMTFALFGSLTHNNYVLTRNHLGNGSNKKNHAYSGLAS